MGTEEKVEVRSLLQTIYECSGYDFREYEYSSLCRRLSKAMAVEDVETAGELEQKLTHNRGTLARVLATLSVTVTSMFRDPPFFRALRERVIPVLQHRRFIRIWAAGCATGEEAYSLAILLTEEGLYDRCKIYATDLDARSIQQAKQRLFPLSAMKAYTRRYIEAGGKESFVRYFTARYDHALFNSALAKNLVFAQHNLVSDAAFNEFHLILSRNVMIYFSRPLQERALEVLTSSLNVSGFLGLGEKETLGSFPCEGLYEVVTPEVNLYRKVRAGKGKAAGQ